MSRTRMFVVTRASPSRQVDKQRTPVCREHPSYAQRPSGFGGLAERPQLRLNAMEFGDVGLVAHIGHLVGQGATQLGLFGRDRDVPMDGQSRSTLMSSLIDDQVKWRCLGPGAAALAIQN